MRVLIVRLSSMGDLIQTLPALTDAVKKHPDIEFDWVVEESFAEIPKWHPAVKNIIPVALRRWRKQPIKTIQNGEWKSFHQQLQANNYDYVIDAHGLIKSAVITRLARTQQQCGLDRSSAREGLASLAYNRLFKIAKALPAVTRIRYLFSQVLNYPLPDYPPEYGIQINHSKLITDNTLDEKNYLIFLHGTTWANKHWPEDYWKQLAQLASAANFKIKLPWGNEVERQRAERIASAVPQCEVLPKMKLTEMANVISAASAVVCMDTGLGHLSAALSVPTIFLYGPTNPDLTGIYGNKQLRLKAHFPCAPCMSRSCSYTQATPVYPACFSSLSPKLVWEKLSSLLNLN